MCTSWQLMREQLTKANKEQAKTFYYIFFCFSGQSILIKQKLFEQHELLMGRDMKMNWQFQTHTKLLTGQTGKQTKRQTDKQTNRQIVKQSGITSTTCWLTGHNTEWSKETRTMQNVNSGQMCVHIYRNAA